MVDLYGYLLRNRVVFLNQRISDTVAIQVCVRCVCVCVWHLS